MLIDRQLRGASPAPSTLAVPRTTGAASTGWMGEGSLASKKQEKAIGGRGRKKGSSGGGAVSTVDANVRAAELGAAGTAGNMLDRAPVQGTLLLPSLAGPAAGPTAGPAQVDAAIGLPPSSFLSTLMGQMALGTGGTSIFQGADPGGGGGGGSDDEYILLEEESEAIEEDDDEEEGVALPMMDPMEIDEEGGEGEEGNEDEGDGEEEDEEQVPMSEEEDSEEDDDDGNAA